MAERPRAIRIRFTRRLPHPIDRVWEALTDPGELHKWWGGAELDLVQGGRFALRWRNTDKHGDAATLDGAVTKLDPPRSLQITAGWHLHLDALATVLAGDEVDIAHPDPLFAPLQQAYAEKYPESPTA